MALSSMTGFARSEGAFAPWSWFWEAKSVNGRSLEIRLRLPPGLDGLETGVRSLAQKHLKRGNLQVALTIDRVRSGADLKLNREALGVVVTALREIAKEGEFAPPDPASILAIKGVLEAGEDSVDEALVARRDELLLASAQAALVGLKRARLAEGAHTAEILAEFFQRISSLADDAEARAALQVPILRERIKEQVRLLLEARQGLSEERLAQELALLAVKTDVREEIDRLRVHVRAGAEMLSSTDTVGRRLDFLSQEMNREANTICSKANDVALTHIGLELKAVIDNVREQVQNVE
jgi:uncharacterized protein (TIGR00255 family)